MCVVLHSDGHIDVLFLFEQMWPVVVQASGKPGHSSNKLDYHLCFDIIFRVRNAGGLDKLSLLVPYSVPVARDGTVTLIPPEEHRQFEWVYRKEVRRRDGVANLYFRNSLDDAKDMLAGYFSVKEVRPIIKMHECVMHWMADMSCTAELGAFVGLGVSVVELQAPDGKFASFDAADPEHTTYWIRFAVKSGVGGNNGKPVVVPFGEMKVNVFPCLVWGSEKVLDDLDEKLGWLANTTVGGAARTRSELVEGIFRCPNSSTRVLEYWVAIVSSGNLLLSNTTYTGRCQFCSVEQVGDGELGRVFFSGARSNPVSDPLSVAEAVYRYLGRFALNPTDAKDKESITSAIGGTNHGNVSHIVDVLARLQFICETAHKYWVQHPIRAETFLDVPEVRNLLYKSKNPDDESGGWLSSGGYRIDFEVLKV